MFNKKSHFALNKRRKDAIIYASVLGEIILTRDDFGSDEEFEKWKSWSDTDYQMMERAGRTYYDHLSYTSDNRDFENTEEDETKDLDREEKLNQWMESVKKKLTPVQYRRLWMYEIDRMTIEEIAEMEGIAHQNVSKSIRAAHKKMLKLSDVWKERNKQDF